MLKLKPKFLKENGEAKFAVFSMKDYAEIRNALEDADDFRILERARRRNAGKRTYSLDEVKHRLAIVTAPRKPKRPRKPSPQNSAGL